MKNEFGRDCWMDFGIGMAKIVDIVKYHKTHGNNSWYILRLHMHTTNETETAEIKVKLLESSRIVKTKKPIFTENSIFISDPIENSQISMNTITDNINKLYISNTTTNIINNNINNDIKVLSISDKCFDNVSDEKTAQHQQQYSNSRRHYYSNNMDNTIQQQQQTHKTTFVNVFSQSFEHKCMEEYSMEYKKEDATFSDWIEGADQVHCPFYPSQVTINDTRLFLPFASYMCYEPVTIDRQYWINAFIIMCSRRGYDSINSYLKSVMDDNDEYMASQIAICAMDMICQLPHSMEYISDQFIDPITKKIKKIENFGDALFAYCGDCEDLSSAIFQLFDDFVLRQSFKVLESDDDKESTKTILMILKHMQTVLGIYIPFLCIEGVSCASAQNQHELKSQQHHKEEEEEESVKITGAHAAIKFIPRTYFKQCLEQWRPNHPIAQLKPQDLNFKVDTRRVCGGPFKHLPFIDNNNSNNNESVLYPWESDMPILIGEGTGMLNSGGEDDPCYDVSLRKLIYTCKAMKASKKPLYPPKGTSPFYKAILFGCTNRFIRDYNIGSFRFCKKTNTSSVFGLHKSTEFHRGILFADLIAMDPNIAVIPYGDLSKDKSEFDNLTLHIMEDTLKVRLKLKPILVYDKLKSVVVVKFPSSIREWITTDFKNKDDTHCVLYDNCDDNIKELLRNTTGFNNLLTLQYRLDKHYDHSHKTSSSSKKNDNDNDTVSVYFDDFYLTSSLCNEIYEYLTKQRNDVILNFYYENISSMVSLWRLSFNFRPH